MKGGVIMSIFHKKAEIEGICDPRFIEVKELFEQHFKEKKEVGASVCFTLNGETVVDLWGGYANKKKHTKWNKDTMAVIYSCTKGMASLCLHMLADKGMISYDDPIAKYWPEFGQNGKENITIQCLMGHRTGLIGPGKALTFKNNEFDWDYVCDEIAKTKPWWTPGEHQGYHMTTYGYMVGELVKRVTGMTIGTYLAQEVTGPLNADVFIEVPESEFYRCADMHNDPKKMSQFIAGAISKQPITSLEDNKYNGVIVGALYIPAFPVNSDTWKRIEVPSANGFASARGLAKVYAALANGGELDGVRLVKEDTVKKMYERQSKENEKDMCLSFVDGVPPLIWGMGYMMNASGEAGPSKIAFGHGGTGGSYSFADPENKVSYAYVMNNYNGGTTGNDDRSKSLVTTFYKCLGK